MRTAPAAPPVAELPASLAARFEKLAVLGQGGAGIVFKARDRLIDREVAIKILLAGLAGQGSILRGEATHLAKLEHERVVRLYDFGEADGAAYLVMEYVRGDTLWKRLASERPPLLEALAIAIELADGLAAAHALGLAHGDVKPMNLFLDRAGHVKIADFGLARPVQEAAAGPKGEVLGTPGYMAPEQVDGMPLTPASDVYAAGVVLIEMLTGQRLFTGRTSLSIMTQQARGPEFRPRDVNPGVPEGLDELAMRCLSRDPARRPTATELAASLREWQERLIRAARSPATAGFPQHPYKFLAHFEPEDAVIFFGRESEVAELAGLIAAPNVRLLMVFAPCGTGKSSLLRAGLVPSLDREYEPIVLQAGADPATALAECLAVERKRTPVVILDQLEELFTLNPPDAPEIPEFMELASRLVEDQERPCKLVLSFRTEFRGRFFALERRLSRHMQSYLVSEMREVGLAAAIEGPSAIESYGFGYEPGFARELASDIVQTVSQRGETAPPILQIVCRQLYDHARANGQKIIGPGLYQKALGGARGALGSYVRERLEGPGYGAFQTLAQQMLRALTVRESGGERYARAREEDDLLAFPDRDAARLVLDQLIADRLVVREDAGKKGWTIRLASEIICPLIDEWADDTSETERAARLLARATRQWAENGRRADDLLSGGGLVMVERQLDHLRSLSPDDLALVDASRGARRARQVKGIAGALCVLAALSSALWLAFFRPGRADIRSNPPGAQVVDAEGRALGTTPLAWNAAPGVYQLTLKKPQYHDLALTVRVPAGGEATYTSVLPYPFGVLTLASDPAGVTCEVLGAAGSVLTTTTPFHAELPTGQYRVKLSGPGVVAQELAGVTLGENREPVERMVRLERDTGWLQVDTTDAGAEMIVRHAKTGQVAATATLPLAGRELPAGDYRLTVQLPDHHTQELSVALTRGTTSLVSAAPPRVKVLWSRPPSRPFAFSAGFDHDADGAPDVLVMDTDLRFRAVSGRTGKNLMESAAAPKFLLDGRETTWPELVSNEKVETLQVGDLDADGKADVILSLDSGRVLGLDPETAVAKFTARYASRSISWRPILRDLDGDNATDVTGLTPDGRLVARSGKNAAEIWSVKVPGDACDYLLVDGLLPGRPLAAIVTRMGAVHALDPRDGTAVWTFEPQAGPSGGEPHIAAGDLDGDGKVDIAAGGLTGVVAISGATGKPFWFKPGLRPMDVKIAKLVKGERRHVVTGAQDGLVALDHRGDVLWHRRDPVWFDDLTIRDMDRDGLDDVVAKRRSNRVEIYRGHDAFLTRSFGNAPDIRYRPGIADLDGDGNLDIIYMNAQRGLVAASGAVEKPVWTFKAPGTVVSTPAAADLDGDGEPDVVTCVNADPTSWLIATSGKDARVLWQAPYPPRAFPFMLGDPCLLLTDVNGDGTADAVILDDKGGLTAHDGKTGKVVWGRPGKTVVPVIGPAAFDAGQHGPALLTRSLYRPEPEGPMRLRALSAKDGHELWKSPPVPPVFTTSPAYREPGRPRPDILTLVLGPKGAEITVLDPETGQPRRVIGAPLTQRRATSLICADFNGDGYDDPVIAPCRLGIQARDGKTGAELWQLPAPDTRTPAGMDMVDDQLALADLNGDGTQDVLYLVLSGHGVGIDGKTGKPLWQSKTSQRILARTTLAHLDGQEVPWVISADASMSMVGLNGKDGGRLKFDLSSAAQICPLEIDPARAGPQTETTLRRETHRGKPSDRARLLVTGRDNVLRLLPLSSYPFR